MRIATWNINGLRARLEFVKHWLVARSPDVVGLQELKIEGDKFPREELEQLGYEALVLGQKSWNGVAVLSRRPLEPAQQGLPGQEEAGARLLSARIDDLLFTTVYVPNGKHVGHADFPLKLAWLDALRLHLEEGHRVAEPAVLCGDFNLCPGPLDTWSEELLCGGIFHTEEERLRFRALTDWGLVDLYRDRHPEGGAFSWWDYRAGAFHKNQGLRIDFLLATPAVAERTREVFIDRDYRKKKDGLIASDHAPVIADLE